MAGELLQHVVEEADPGRDIEHAGAVEIDRRRDLGLLGLAGNRRLPLQLSPLRLTLPHLDRAFISLSPAVPEPHPAARGLLTRSLDANAMQTSGPHADEPRSWHATTILTIRKDGRVVI